MLGRYTIEDLLDMIWYKIDFKFCNEGNIKNLIKVIIKKICQGYY